MSFEVEEVVHQTLAVLCGYSTENSVSQDLVERVTRAAAQETGHKANVVEEIDSALGSLQANGYIGFEGGWSLREGNNIALSYSLSPERGTPEDHFMRDQATRLPCFARSFGTDDLCNTCPGRYLCRVVSDIRLSIISQVMDEADSRRRDEIRKEEERQAAEDASRLNAALSRQRREEELEEAEPIEDIMARLNAAAPTGPTQPATRPFQEVEDVPDGTYCCVCKAKIKAGSRARMREGEGTYHIGCEGR